MEFKYVPEISDGYLKLFPHRFDFLWAKHTTPGTRPNWKTESRHPLADRAVRQGQYLYGVRFGSSSQYLMIDIDKGSTYHPKSDPFAVYKMAETLEELGISAFIPVTSSYGGGVHVYFPFSHKLPTHQIAGCAEILLQQAGFVVQEGQLEIYPNHRPYDPELNSLYKGHRLPMQAGSYVLTDDWELFTHKTSAFIDRWKFCARKNDVQPSEIDQLWQRLRKRHHKISQKAAKFLADLDADILPGWTDHGQTNYLLGRIALRTYVFGDIVHGKLRTGQALADAIAATAIATPGYRDWCRHQQEIHKRAEDWARCVEASKYWPYRTKKEKPQGFGGQRNALPEGFVTWQKFQQDQARAKITLAIGKHLDAGTLPSGATDRFKVLVGEHISGQTLYKHRDLWHPDELWKTPSDTPNADSPSKPDLAEGPSGLEKGPKLIRLTRCNDSPSEACSDFVTSEIADPRCNTPASKGYSDSHRKSISESQDTGEEFL